MLGLGCWALGIEPLLAIVAGAPVMYGIARGGLAVVELRQVSDKLCSVGGALVPICSKDRDVDVGVSLSVSVVSARHDGGRLW